MPWYLRMKTNPAIWQEIWKERSEQRVTNPWNGMEFVVVLPDCLCGWVVSLVNHVCFIRATAGLTLATHGKSSQAGPITSRHSLGWNISGAIYLDLLGRGMIQWLTYSGVWLHLQPPIYWKLSDRFWFKHAGTSTVNWCKTYELWLMVGIRPLNSPHDLKNTWVDQSFNMCFLTQRSHHSQ